MASSYTLSTQGAKRSARGCNYTHCTRLATGLIRSYITLKFHLGRSSVTPVLSYDQRLRLEVLLLSHIVRLSLTTGNKKKIYIASRRYSILLAQCPLHNAKCVWPT